MAEETPLRLETKMYDSNTDQYLYGLNKKIPDKEFEKAKPYMKRYRRKDFPNGNLSVTGRPDGYRCTEEDVPKVEKALGITNTLEKRKEKVRKAFEDPTEKEKLKGKAFEWLQTLFEKGGTHPEQDLSRLVIHSTKIYDPDDNYKDGKKDGEGMLFIYTPHGMWYVINNSRKGVDHSRNNLKSADGGAIGYRLMYDDRVDMLIRIYTEENPYTGEKLY